VQIAGTHVLITGTTSGIGKQLSVDLLQKGARVTSLDRRANDTGDPRWVSLTADIREEEQVKTCLARVHGPVNILINNAGVMRRSPLLETSREDFDVLVDTHVKGPWLVLKYALPLLTPGALVVQMSSRHALSLPINPALYGLTKRWVTDMMEVFAKTYPQFRVKILCPGPVDTSLTKVGTTPEELETKRKMMCSPEELSTQIIELLESDTKSRLLFDIRTSTHFLE
jgi:NAD(P)-dependent dehydrogenase (short-subunit alcohol dehydrogenase family)